jgi:hypothetical protein
VHKLYDQIIKRIGRRILEPGGEVVVQHEVAPDARAIDLWFQPGPSHAAVRERQGVLGRMTDRPAILEPHSGTPGLDDARVCIYKQLALDGLRLAEARRKKEGEEEQARPPFPYLWVLGTGRAKSVIDAYGLDPMPGFPTGFWTRREADALGLVSLRDVPRERDTLLLRLMAGVTCCARRSPSSGGCRWARGSARWRCRSWLR